MERALLNTQAMVPRGIMGVMKGYTPREWRADKEKTMAVKPAMFNVEFLHDAVWGGETDWRPLAAQKAGIRAAQRRQPAFFNVELLHDAVWEG